VDENGYEKLAFVQPDQFDDMIPLFFMDAGFKLQMQLLDG
jgi:hypothetical protein